MVSSVLDGGIGALPDGAAVNGPPADGVVVPGAGGEPAAGWLSLGPTAEAAAGVEPPTVRLSAVALGSMGCAFIL